MVRLKVWQWVALGLPIVLIVGFLLFAAGLQIHAWGINWIWAIVGLVFVGWRWLLVRWTHPALVQVEALMAEMTEDVEAMPASDSPLSATESLRQAETALQKILEASHDDPPVWENSDLFWQRCQELVTAIAQVYYPNDKQPLLNIYVPQAYALLRGTVDDLDQWMQKLGPALNQVTVGQAYQAYQLYRQLEPSARKLWRVWNWAQWLLNPAAAVARQASQRSSDRANQELLLNLSQLLRQTTLRNLGRQAIALYGGMAPPLEQIPSSKAADLKVQSQTLKEILAQAEPPEQVKQKPVNILLVGRTGAGKSSLINTLFVEPRAAVDVLPNTDRIQAYHWSAPTGEELTLWDSPGYEQANRPELKEQVLDHLQQADLVLLATPALDPALQMDADFLQAARKMVPDLPVIVVVTQVDRLRPLREWSPPYDWQWGDRPKEIAIREATQYRNQQLGEFCSLVLPLVTADVTTGRTDWGTDTLSLALIDAIAPAKQLRLARFLNHLETRTLAAVRIIDHYAFQMATTQGLTVFLKSPVLRFLSTLATGSPTLAYLLAEKIPMEQLPVVIGKLQMAYELFGLLTVDQPDGRNFDLLTLWPLLLDNQGPADRNAWAFGHALTEYWTGTTDTLQLPERFRHYLQVAPSEQASRLTILTPR
jgi:hypothetical protein